ncbi:hypothetical protein CDAR_514991 [Caerostris darwini]|uniref:Uncharacterized protein n=1 Tax=Caerostris darwini TaxID=1538125 RepID=A0AAV4WXT5_9ARAC|nr:hypothetical protein CDAR_514991 [Caerostris darwini]
MPFSLHKCRISNPNCQSIPSPGRHKGRKKMYGRPKTSHSNTVPMRLERDESQNTCSGIFFRSIFLCSQHFIPQKKVLSQRLIPLTFPFNASWQTAIPSCAQMPHQQSKLPINTSSRETQWKKKMYGRPKTSHSNTVPMRLGKG